jgi:hypothetical protein
MATAVVNYRRKKIMHILVQNQQIFQYMSSYVSNSNVIIFIFTQ